MRHTWLATLALHVALAFARPAHCPPLAVPPASPRCSLGGASSAMAALCAGSTATDCGHESESASAAWRCRRQHRGLRAQRGEGEGRGERGAGRAMEQRRADCSAALTRPFRTVLIDLQCSNSLPRLLLASPLLASAV